MLASNPYVGRKRDEDLKAGLRSFPVGKYIIVYQVDCEDVLILNVLHGSRNIQALFAQF